MEHRRRAGSDSLRLFLRDYLLPVLDGIAALHSADAPEVDDADNVVFEILCPDGSRSTTMFSCHTDTVHPGLEGMQRLVYSKDSLYVAAEDKSQLGADDAVGIWVMLNLAHAGKPGLYMFHAEEEIGGKGSKFAASTYDVKHLKRAIAFDRKNVKSVITHQAGGRCCSDTFADALCEGLNAHGLNLSKDSGGVFTDTANYTTQIAECTNISAGYYREHTFSEHLDVGYAQKLRNACLLLDWDALPSERDPHERPKQFSSFWDDDERDMYSDTRWRPYYTRSGANTPAAEDLPDDTPDDEQIPTMGFLLAEYHSDIADFLHSYGITNEDFAIYLMDAYGIDANQL